jgi:adenylate cyclase
MPRFRKAVGLGIFIAALAIVLRPTPLGVRLEEDVARRWLFAVRGPVEAPPGVAVVSIDKTSSDQLGLAKEDWPPPRHVHAAVVRSLTRLGASAIVLDVFFRASRDPAADTDLAAAMAESGKVAVFERVERLKYSGGEIVQVRSPIEQFRTAALATGAFPLPDQNPVSFFWTFLDGTSEKIPTLPAVALQILALPHLDRLLSLLREEGVTNLTDLPSRVATVDDFRQVMNVLLREIRSNADAARRALERLEQDTSDRTTAGERRVLAALIRLYRGGDTHDLNFFGPAAQIRTIPFHELLADGPRPRVDLTGVVVFVGEGASDVVTSADQRDTYSTVYSEDGVDLSGAEIAATAFANLMTNRTLRRIPIAAEIGILGSFALLAACAALLLTPGRAAGALVVLGTAHYALAQHLFSVPALLVPVGIPLLVEAPLSLFTAVWMRYRNVRTQVPREVDADTTPQQVHGVCLSTDIENYVAASEGMEPRDLAALMNDYYTTLSRLVAHRHGMMLGRAGDSTMCVWADTRPSWWIFKSWRSRLGQSASDARARANACQAALDIHDAVVRFRDRQATPVRTRIGLHVGPVALGPVRGEYHVIGEVPNTASRIEALNKHLRTSILASEAVVHEQEGFVLRPVGHFLLAGRSRSLEIVEILGRRDTVGESNVELQSRFASALAAFQRGDMAEAEGLFQALTSEYPSDGPSLYYHRLCSGQQALSVTATSPRAIRLDVK